jgi:hypothetical protein
MIHGLFFDGIMLHSRSLTVNQGIEGTALVFSVPAESSLSFSNSTIPETKPAHYCLGRNFIIESGFNGGEYGFGAKLCKRATQAQKSCGTDTGFEK